MKRPREILTLGVETSCDETSVSVTSGSSVLANVVTSSVHLHKKYGGVVPEIASRYHVEYIIDVLALALKRSGRDLDEIALVAVTNGPGLVGALLTGLSLAKALSYSLKRPIIGVNHVLAHLHSAFLNDGERPSFPFVGLVVSGGHTVLYLCRDVDDHIFLGQTQDDAVGEAFDKVAKMLGLGYPGGPIIERRARRSVGGAGISFPRSYLGAGSLDFSFSGVKTAVLYYVRKAELGARLGAETIDDICYAFQESALDVLVDKSCLAARQRKVGSIVVGGGVAANGRLREKFARTAQDGGAAVFFPKMAYCLDNAAMVGFLGAALFSRGHVSDLYLNVEPNLRAG